MLRFLLIVVIASCKQLFLYHDQQDEEIEMFKFFHDVNDGYYVDIGAFDPVIISNTINLYAKGWNGINVEANYERFAQFPLIKPFDVSLNLAISDKQQYLTFYEYKGDPTQSTASPKVYSAMDKKSMTQFQVPSMSMKQLCHRYFKKRPNLLNLDIQGYSSHVLKNNDWNNSLCRPQIIICQKDNIPNTLKFIVSNKQFMAEHGYTYHSESLYNEYYIENVTFNNFTQKYSQGEKLLKSKTTVRWLNLLTQLYKHLKIPQTIKPASRSNNRGGHFFYHYPKQNTLVSLQNLNKMSNELTDKKDRPILILKFNPLNTKIVIASQYTRSKITVKEWDFQIFTVEKADGGKFDVYIFLAYGQQIQPYTTFLSTNEQLNQVHQNKINSKPIISPSTKPSEQLSLSNSQIPETSHQKAQTTSISSSSSSSSSPSLPSYPSPSQNPFNIFQTIATTALITAMISFIIFRMFLIKRASKQKSQQKQTCNNGKFQGQQVAQESNTDMEKIDDIYGEL